MEFSDVGPGWDVAKIDDKEEFEFFSHVHRYSLDQTSYLIGGTSVVNPSDNIIELRQFGFPDDGKILFNVQVLIILSSLIQYSTFNVISLWDKD